MKFPTGLGPTAVFCGLTLLAGCKSGDPNPPTFNAALSNPANLQIETTAGAPAVNGYFVHYDNASSETISDNPDQLLGATIDGSGATGALFIAPPASQLPGIYYLGIHGQNTNGTVVNTVVVNVAPALNSQPTIVNFPMNGNATQRNAGITLFSARSEITNGSGLNIFLPDGVTNPSGHGVFVNAITATQLTGTNTYSLTADLTVTAADLQTQPVTITSTDALGTTTTTTYNCMLLQFQATPFSNGFTLTPYQESICLNPV
jgi:hypothetical protein